MENSMTIVPTKWSKPKDRTKVRVDYTNHHIRNFVMFLFFLGGRDSSESDNVYNNVSEEFLSGLQISVSNNLNDVEYPKTWDHH